MILLFCKKSVGFEPRFVIERSEIAVPLASAKKLSQNGLLCKFYLRSLVLRRASLDRIQISLILFSDLDILKITVSLASLYVLIQY